MTRLVRRVTGKVAARAVRDRRGVHLAVTLRGRPFGREDTTPEAAVAPDLRSDAIRLNVGGGKGHPRVEGWQIVDLRARTADVVVDIAQEPLPFADGSVAVVFCSHTLEHIPIDRLGFVLSEFHRVLTPETGLLRVLVPDIAKAVRAYAGNDYGFFRSSEIGQFDPDAPIGGLLASWFYSIRQGTEHGGGHVHAFDYDYMAHWLRRAGFRQVWESSYRGSILPELRSDAFDRHPQDSLFVEAHA
jgi:SAM-dependent methyltransferase